MSVHQPPSRVWESFDTLTLLSQGLLLYSGPIHDAVPMLERTSGETFPQNCNPADFMLDLINGDFEHDEEARNDHRKRLEMISARYFSSEIHESVKTGIQCHCEEVPLSETKYYHAGFFAQTYHLTKRALWNHTLHPGFYWAKLVIYILLDFVIASIFNQSQSFPDLYVVGLLYFIQTILVLLTIAGLPALILVRPVFIKERANGLIDTAPYVIATFLAMAPWVLSAAVLSGVIIALIVDLANILWLIAILSATVLCAESMMNLVASITNQFIVGLAIASGIYGAFMINTGFILPHQYIQEEYSFGRLLHHMSFHKYSFRSMLVNEFREEKYYREPQFLVTCQDINAEFSRRENNEVGYSGELSVCNSGMPLQKSSPMLQLYQVESVSLVNDMGILIGYVFILQLIIFVVTYCMHKGRR